MLTQVIHQRKLDLHFRYLPSYVNYLLETKLEEFVRKIMQSSYEAELPMLKFFSSYTMEDMVALGMESNRKMLTAISESKIDDYIADVKKTWLENQLPMISREQILAEDITLVNYIRRNTFRQLLPSYTTDEFLWMEIMGEVDRFTVTLDSVFINTYLNLQNDEITKANIALKKREQQLLDAQEIGNIGSYEWDMKNGHSTYSPQLKKIFDLNPEDTNGHEDFMNQIHPDDIARVRYDLEKSFRTGELNSEFRFIKNNQEKYVLSRGKVYLEDNIPVRLVGTVMDITEKQNIILQLQKSEDINKQAQALTHLGNWKWHLHSNQVDWSDELYRIYDLEPQSEPISFERFNSFIQEEDKEKVSSVIHEMITKTNHGEGHFRIITAKGNHKILNTKGEVTRNQKGEPVEIVGTSQDVTTEYTLTGKLREREQYLHMLNQSLEIKNEELIAKNKELESFNFIASHDLQEPLRKIQLFSNRILNENNDGLRPTSLNYFLRIQNAAERMQKLIDDFLAFSQTMNTEVSIEDVNLNTLIEESISELQTRVTEKNAMIRYGILPGIRGVHFQLKQLFVNLLSNSLKYAHKDRTPEITIHSTFVSNDMVQISYSDNGIGFDQVYAEKVFELFQRLHNKDQYSGTGIGLALCKKICENHGGTISVTSTPGEGTTFFIRLPVNGKVKK